eukprot:6213050-Pleurochrysis_carterae.AAC.2
MSAVHAALIGDQQVLRLFGGVEQAEGLHAERVTGTLASIPDEHAQATKEAAYEKGGDDDSSLREADAGGVLRIVLVSLHQLRNMDMGDAFAKKSGACCLGAVFGGLRLKNALHR